MHTELYVANLADSITERALRELFSEYGEVNSIRLPTDSKSGERCGYGFVEMATAVAARAAKENLSGRKGRRQHSVSEASARRTARKRLHIRGSGGVGAVSADNYHCRIRCPRPRPASRPAPPTPGAPPPR